MAMKTTADKKRFWSKVLKVNGGCWLWTAGVSAAGYGRLQLDGRAQYAHRLAWLDIRGPIPAGLQVDHVCRVRACVNPDHLEIVTRRENILRGLAPSAVSARKTHCVRGHELPSRNTGVRRRRCRECGRQWMAARRKRDRGPL